MPLVLFRLSKFVSARKVLLLVCLWRLFVGRLNRLVVWLTLSVRIRSVLVFLRLAGCIIGLFNRACRSGCVERLWLALVITYKVRYLLWCRLVRVLWRLR